MLTQRQTGAPRRMRQTMLTWMWRLHLSLCRRKLQVNTNLLEDTAFAGLRLTSFMHVLIQAAVRRVSSFRDPDCQCRPGVPANSSVATASCIDG